MINRTTLLLAGILLFGVSCEKKFEAECSGQSSNIEQVSVHQVPTFCMDQGSTTILDGTVSNDSLLTYTWSTGHVGSTVVVTEPGDYSVLITDSSGSLVDSSGITVVQCESSFIAIPESFTPNGDGLNEGWAPLASNVCSILVMVHDQDGDVIYETTDVNSKWDGVNEDSGKTYSPGPYLYRVDISFRDGTSRNFSGEVELIR